MNLAINVFYEHCQNSVVYPVTSDEDIYSESANSEQTFIDVAGYFLSRDDLKVEVAPASSFACRLSRDWFDP